MSKATERALESAKRREATEKLKQQRLTALGQMDRAASALRTAKSEKRYADVRQCALDVIDACDELRDLAPGSPTQDAGAKLAAE